MFNKIKKENIFFFYFHHFNYIYKNLCIFFFFFFFFLLEFLCLWGCKCRHPCSFIAVKPTLILLYGGDISLQSIRKKKKKKLKNLLFLLLFLWKFNFLQINKIFIGKNLIRLLHHHHHLLLLIYPLY